MKKEFIVRHKNTIACLKTENTFFLKIQLLLTHILCTLPFLDAVHYIQMVLYFCGRRVWVGFPCVRYWINNRNFCTEAIIVTGLFIYHSTRESYKKNEILRRKFVINRTFNFLCSEIFKNHILHLFFNCKLTIVNSLHNNSN